MGTIRTEEYKRDLAEFQARRSSVTKELPDTPVKRKCGRHSLPVSCTDCTGDPDRTFNYEKKSAAKYKKNHRRTRSAQEDQYDTPNIQFLFQNQVFMPGNFPRAYSEPKTRRKVRRSPEFLAQRHIEFDDNQAVSPPLFYKNNSLPFDVKEFLESHEEVDGMASGDKTSPCMKNDSCEEMMEVMSELKNLDRWADDQLGNQSLNTTKSDDSKSSASTLGLPIVSSCNLDMTVEKNNIWTKGTWGVVPVQMKKLPGVTVEHVKKKMCMEISILRKCRHPNIILLMGLYPDSQNNIHIICERCVDTLFNLLHIEVRILSVQTSVQYALDIANALVFLSMHGYIHTELNSTSVVVTSHTAKLADLSACMRLNKKGGKNKTFDMYSPEPQYVNLTEPLLNSGDCEPLISARSSEAYLSSSVVKHYKQYSESELYKWQAPELFVPDDEGLVRPCSKTDVYSLALILWECCNASMPWKSLSYTELKQEYTLYKTGIRLPQDGTYPGSLLALLRQALALDRQDRLDLTKLQEILHNVKENLDDMEYIILPERISNRSRQFTNSTSPTDSECQSPRNVQHEAIVHTNSAESDKESEYQNSVYELPKINSLTYVSGKCSTDDDEKTYVDKNYSACSTPVGNMRTKIKYLETPCSMTKSDSTEYCSILSPDVRTNLALADESFKDQNDRSAKLSRSFTPKSYKPLHIKVPEFNLDSIKGILKDQTTNEKSSYNFDIKNYSLPTTPIARSNKLRKNAWLSGDITAKMEAKPKLPVLNTTVVKSPKEEVQPLPEASTTKPLQSGRDQSRSTESLDTGRDSYTGLRRINDPPPDFSPDPEPLERTRSLTCLKTPYVEDVLANVNVKPLVAIHERWIYEANKRTGRSVPSLEQHRPQTRAVKPASHCVDTLPKSVPLVRRSSFKCLRPSPANVNTWDQYNIAREAIAKGLSFQTSEAMRKLEKSTITDTQPNEQPKIDRATDTQGIEDFIKGLIRKEVQHLLNDMSDNISESNSQRDDELLNKRVHNIVDSLKNGEDVDIGRKDIPKSFSRIKINGNNKPLVQITFNRNGENSLQVLDNCVNVTVSENSCSRDKLNISLEDTLTGEDIHINGLKRCQAFSAIQEARSTEDLYIDDDLSTQMQENFGGKVKLIPLHGSLHEILCEKEDDCCLVKVKQENGCDTIYFRCDNSDTESRDATDGNDTVVYKRSISLIEERIQRVIPKDKRSLRRLSLDRLRSRPKSEVLVKNLGESRARSNSSPSLFKPDEVELNIENVMSYQDSSSDECLRCQADDDFEVLEREIEEDLANSSLTCGCLEKISEENLSVINEDY
ncbi:uncharacterized protein LOC121734510 isoform X2 [Aricia agestis]|nr:uncharacterized protein LOC121734510 isoform X2 [Aricia agestis]